MPQSLQNISIAAPAFKGLNTQDSPLTSDPSFAAIADNCVIDKFGRIGARKGFSVLTTDNTPLGSAEIISMGLPITEPPKSSIAILAAVGGIAYKVAT